MTLDNDHFVADQPIVLKPDVSKMRLQLASDTPAKHVARLDISDSRGSNYDFTNDGKRIAAFETKSGPHSVCDLPVNGGLPNSYVISRLR